MAGGIALGVLGFQLASHIHSPTLTRETHFCWHDEIAALSAILLHLVLHPILVEVSQ
jgi:hypothetical protein